MNTTAKNFQRSAFNVQRSTVLAGLCSLCFLLFIAGCSVVTGQRTPDGTITVTSWRCLWKTEAVTVSAAYAATNFNIHLSVGKSQTDSAAVAAVASGAVKGLTHP